MSWPRLQRLIGRLPRDSWTARAIIGEEARWGETEHLLATLIDAQMYGNYLMGAAHFKNPPPMPEPLLRPGAPARSATPAVLRSPAEIDAILERMTPKEVTDGGS